MSKDFRRGNNIPEVVNNHIEKEGNNKKLKLETGESSKKSEEQTQDEEVEAEDDFQGSYILTMSQTVCKDMDYTFEPFTQVKIIGIIICR